MIVLGKVGLFQLEIAWGLHFYQASMIVTMIMIASYTNDDSHDDDDDDCRNHGCIVHK